MAWHLSRIYSADTTPFLIIIYRPFFPPGYSRMKIVVYMFDFGCRCGVHYGRISHPGKPTLLQEELCYAPPTPIERKSCLVIPRLQHVRSLTPRAAAAVSRTDRRLTCTGTYVV